MDSEHGEIAVKLARKAVENVIHNKKQIPEIPQELGFKSGVFVTLESFPEHVFRGSAGYPEPITSLGEAVIKSAVAACADPRFPSLTVEELKTTVFEVSVMSYPITIQHSTPEELLEKIVPGRDGLILEYGSKRAVFPPKVSADWKWTPKEYLEKLCERAGLPSDAWKGDGVAVHAFTEEIFCEEEPRKQVIRK